MAEAREYKITRSEVIHDDNLLIALEGVTDEDGYYIQAEPGQISSRIVFSRDSSIKLQLYYSVDPDVILIDRTVYSTFMLLGDVGGLTGLLFTVSASLVSLLTYNKPENKLVEKLFSQ